MIINVIMSPTLITMSEEQSTYGPQRKEGCIFCDDEIITKIITSHGTVFAIESKYPATDGHVLIIPYRHTLDFFSMTPQEMHHSEELLLMLKTKILDNDITVTGFNIGMNCGESAGQTVMHAHTHLIPRRDGDVMNRRGEVMHVIPDKGNC